MNKIDTLEIKVSGICNLNCKACGHFANITSPNVPVFYDLEKFKSDIKILKDNVEIPFIMLIGGEPLLCKDILELSKITRNYFPNSDILIYTNGINISKMSKEFFITIKDLNIRFLITLYSETIKYKEDNENIMNKYGIKYEYFNNGNIMNKFSKSVFLEPINNVYTAYRRCSIKHITFLTNGKLYKCPTVANINVLGEKYDLPQFKEVPDKYGIDIHKVTNWKEAIKKLNSPENCCKYCDDTKTPWVDWKLGEPELSDWIIN